MRWSELFDDFEAQLRHADREAFNDEVRERAQAESAAVAFGAVLSASEGDTVRLTLVDGTVLQGVITDCAAQWLHVTQGPREWLVPASAVGILDSPRMAAPEPGPVATRLTFGHALRALAAAEAEVVVNARGGHVRGRIGAVGADYVVITGGGERRLVPFAAVLSVGPAPA